MGKNLIKFLCSVLKAAQSESNFFFSGGTEKKKEGAMSINLRIGRVLIFLIVSFVIISINGFSAYAKAPRIGTIVVHEYGAGADPGEDPHLRFETVTVIQEGWVDNSGSGSSGIEDEAPPPNDSGPITKRKIVNLRTIVIWNVVIRSILTLL